MTILLYLTDTPSPATPPAADQLRLALAHRSVRVVDLFRNWDEDASGAVTRQEFSAHMGERLRSRGRAETDTEPEPGAGQEGAGKRGRQEGQTRPV